MTDRLAVNCLTGAFGTTQYTHTDPDTGQSTLVTSSFADVERNQYDSNRLLLHDNSTELGTALMGLACTCPAPKVVTAAPTDAELQSLYDRYIAGPMSKEEDHISFLRVKSKDIGMAAMAKLKAGASFESVFDEYASPFDAHAFVHGDLGAHLEVEWGPDDMRVFRQLKVGELSLTPIKGSSRWVINKLQSRRIIPAPPLTAVRSRVSDYVTRAHACGWEL